ncbi:hypothetical protein QYF36_000402 [Acer negundo]|nr:hypothetical protein QYF36_000402 [Acer negundo]
MDSSTILYNQLKAAEPFFLLAGPNVIESEEHVLHMASRIKSISTKLGLPLVFKSSFDKANRTSSKSFRGPGMIEGLKILEKVKITHDIPIVTDVHESIQCEAVGRVADIIQIPAFLCRQTDLLVAAAKTGKIVNIKKGQFCAPSVMENSAQKVRLAGNSNVMVCERGTMFGYNDLIVDPRNLEWMREANCPVVADITHSLQQPAGKKLDGGGVASGGLRELIPCIARTAVAVGVDGIFMEVHDDPLNAPVDGPTQWPLRHLEELLEELVAIAFLQTELIMIDATPGIPRGISFEVIGLGFKPAPMQEHDKLISAVNAFFIDLYIGSCVRKLGKLKMGINRVTEDSRARGNVGGRNLIVYSEDEKVKLDANSIRNSVTDKKAAALTSVSDTKVIAFSVRPFVSVNLMGVGGTLNKMENKGKGVSSAYTKVGRKALADVSNIPGPPGNIARNVVQDGSKNMKGEKSAILKRVLVRPGLRTVNTIPRKSFTGKVSESISQGASDIRASKKGTKDLTSSLADQWAKTKGRGRESILTDRRSSRNPPVPTRRSLPVLKQVNQVDTSSSKENAESSEKAKDTTGFSVKAKLGTKVVYRLSNSRNQFWRNRASDGFMTITARVQNKVDAPSSKFSVKPNGKTALMASNAKGTLKSKVQSGVNKPISVAAISSKKTKEGVRSSLPEDIASMVSHEAAQGKPSFEGNSNASTNSSDIMVSHEAAQGKPSFEGKSNASTNSSDIMVSHEAAQGKPSFEGNSNASTNSSDIVPKRKSNRRRSYTSLLMASSKLLEEHGEVAGQGKLPSIDDDCNQLEVAEYVDEIYQYYWIMEAQNPLPGNYMSIQTDITPLMRGILINWLIEVHFKFELMQETLYLMVTLLDRYLSQVQIKKNEMQLVGLTALLLASKYEDFWHPRIKDLISVSAESYTRDHMLRMEKLMLKTLKFRLNVPTPYVFMLRFLKAAQSDTKLEHLAFYLTELSLVEYEALKFKPSLLCASAIYVARDCAEMILRFHKAAGKGKLKVTYEKYTKPDLSSVAAIKPLDSLPS